MEHPDPHAPDWQVWPLPQLVPFATPGVHLVVDEKGEQVSQGSFGSTL
jgi:hypothetical protein